MLKLSVSKLFFLTGILTLLVTFLAIFLSRMGFASRVIAFAFWFFVIALVFYLLELAKNENK